MGQSRLGPANGFARKQHANNTRRLRVTAGHDEHPLRLKTRTSNCPTTGWTLDALLSGSY